MKCLHVSFKSSSYIFFHIFCFNWPGWVSLVLRLPSPVPLFWLLSQNIAHVYYSPPVIPSFCPSCALACSSTTIQRNIRAATRKNASSLFVSLFCSSVLLFALLLPGDVVVSNRKVPGYSMVWWCINMVPGMSASKLTDLCSVTIPGKYNNNRCYCLYIALMVLTAVL